MAILVLDTDATIDEASALIGAHADCERLGDGDMFRCADSIHITAEVDLSGFTFIFANNKGLRSVGSSGHIIGGKLENGNIIKPLNIIFENRGFSVVNQISNNNSWIKDGSRWTTYGLNITYQNLTSHTEVSFICDTTDSTFEYLSIDVLDTNMHDNYVTIKLSNNSVVSILKLRNSNIRYYSAKMSFVDNGFGWLRGQRGGSLKLLANNKTFTGFIPAFPDETAGIQTCSTNFGTTTMSWVDSQLSSSRILARPQNNDAVIRIIGRTLTFNIADGNGTNLSNFSVRIVSDRVVEGNTLNDEVTGEIELYSLDGINYGDEQVVQVYKGYRVEEQSVDFHGQLVNHLRDNKLEVTVRKAGYQEIKFDVLGELGAFDDKKQLPTDVGYSTDYNSATITGINILPEDKRIELTGAVPNLQVLYNYIKYWLALPANLGVDDFISKVGINYILSYKIHMLDNAVLSIDPRVEKLTIDTGITTSSQGRIVYMFAGSTLNLGTSYTLLGETVYTEGVALDIKYRSSGWNGSNAGIYQFPNAIINWQGATVLTNSMNQFDGVVNYNEAVLQAGLPAGVNSNSAGNIVTKFKGTTTGKGITVWGAGLTLDYDIVLNSLTLENTRVGVFKSKVQLIDYAGIGNILDVGLYSGSTMRFLNAKDPSTIKTGKPYSSSSRTQYGITIISSEVTLQLSNSLGNALGNGAYYLKDVNNGSRVDYTSGSAQVSTAYRKDYTPDNVHTGTFTNGLVEAGAVILKVDTRANFSNDESMNYDIRTKLDADGNMTTLLDITVWAYGYNPETVELDFKGVGIKNKDWTALEDKYITEVDEVLVEAYEGIDINHTTKTISITEDHNLDELYDYIKLDKLNNITQPAVNELLATVSGTVLGLGLYSIAISSVLTKTDQFDTLDATAIGVTGSLTAHYVNSDGTVKVTFNGLDVENFNHDLIAILYKLPESTDWATIHGNSSDVVTNLQADTTYMIKAYSAGYTHREFNINTAEFGVTIDVDLLPVLDASDVNLYSQAVNTLQVESCTFNPATSSVLIDITGNAQQTFNRATVFRIIQNITHNEQLIGTFANPIHINTAKDGFVIPAGNFLMVSKTARTGRVHFNCLLVRSDGTSVEVGAIQKLDGTDLVIGRNTMYHLSEGITVTNVLNATTLVVPESVLEKVTADLPTTSKVQQIVTNATA